MRRQYKRYLNYFILLLASFFCGFYTVSKNRNDQPRKIASTADWQSEDFEKAFPSISANEFLDSNPGQGRSYFDQIFSSGDQYQIPFPFNKIVKKLSDYSGQPIDATDSLGLKISLFPMGRSLQRNAAIVGQTNTFSYDPFFRFPRAVIGFTEDTQSPNELRLNLKNKFYLGYNERAEILEVISFNDKSGRYEYQIVKNYGPGKIPEVFYANRSLCLSCHQNQTPIFSRGPWSESNANPFVHEKLQTTFDQVFGKKNCQKNQDEPYCYSGDKAYYFGMPVKVDISIPSLLDGSTDQANLIHTYQKMWTQLCPTLECRLQFVRAAIVFRLTSNLGLIPDEMMATELALFEKRWKQNFPNGILILNPNIPNRDPFRDIVNSNDPKNNLGLPNINDKTVQELLALSKIPSEFEPLQIRQPLDIWLSSGFDINQTNHLIRGLAEEFSSDDLNIFQKGLQLVRRSDFVLTTTQSLCEIQNENNTLLISCDSKNNDHLFKLNGYLTIQNNTLAGEVSDFKIISSKLKCDPTAPATDTNVFSGKSCPSVQNLSTKAHYSTDKQKLFIKLLNSSSGLPYFTLHGYDASEIVVDLKTKKAELTVYNSMHSLNLKQRAEIDKILMNKYFSRLDLMKSFMTTFKMTEPKIEKLVSPQLPLKIDSHNIPISEDAVLAQLNGFQLMQKVCSTCHQNDEAVPPNFMGSAFNQPMDSEQCRRIEQCSARILYRLKVRRCDLQAAEKKKNPMPPPSFFKKNPHLTDSWMTKYNPKIIQYVSSLVDVKKLSLSLQKNGLNQVEAEQHAQDLLTAQCPQANSVIYDQFPVCEFNQLNIVSQCK